ncbi:hypothetical protein C8Q76DRAFT_323638 [Earliella scabrosa]|nr:hypothetical protein C8Q76DRAFT_323638 [Earliella scabrosa]
MMHSLLYAFCASLLLVLASAQNTPPPVIVPSTGDVWTVGERRTVVWSIEGINVYNPSLQPLRGRLFLGQFLNETTEYIWFNNPLATNFTYLQQQVDIIVPAVPTARTYFILLLGQSDNWSAPFTINNPADPQGTGTLGVNITVTTVSQTTTISASSSSESVSASVTTSSSSLSLSSSSSWSSSSSASPISTPFSATAPPASTSSTNTTSGTTSGGGSNSAGRSVSRNFYDAFAGLLFFVLFVA